MADHLKLAIKKLGGPTAAAKSLDVKRASIYDWYRDGITLARAHHIANVSGVPIEKLMKYVRKKAA